MKPKELALTANINVMLTPREKSDFLQRCEAAGRTPSEVLRHLVKLARISRGVTIVGDELEEVASVV